MPFTSAFLQKKISRFSKSGSVIYYLSDGKINLYDIGLSEEELKRRRAKKYELKKALKGCTYGDVNDKKYVKTLIYDLLLNLLVIESSSYLTLLIYPDK